MTQIETYLTTREVAELTATKPQTLAVWRTRGEGPPYVRIGRAVRYPLSELREWLECRTQRFGSQN